MHTLWNRASAIFFFSVTVLFCAGLGSWITLNTMRSMRDPSARGRVMDRALMSFDLDADLRGVFNWNVKQLFVYVTADYATKSLKENSVVIWDSIITSKQAAHLKLKNQLNKYPLFDQNAELRGAPVSLTLHWDVMPLTGLLHLEQKGRYSMKLPADYCDGADCKPEIVVDNTEL